MKFRQKCECTCNKPKLLHLPCSHVLAACRMLQLDPISFVARYYLKEVMLNTWNGEIWGFQAIGNFNTVNPDERQYIPDPSLVRTNRGRRQCRHIQNDMDESEAGGPTKQCFLCNMWGHRDTCMYCSFRHLGFRPQMATPQGMYCSFLVPYELCST
jgi:hypothetical protein